MASLLETTLALVPSIVKGESVLSQPFLSTCRQVLPVLDKLGTGLSIVRSDVSGNIEVRPEIRHESYVSTNLPLSLSNRSLPLSISLTRTTEASEAV